MNPVDVESYVRQLDRELRKRFVLDADILEEVHGHLTDAVERGAQRGHSFPSAQAAAIERFGAPALVAAAYAADRSRGLYRCLFIAAIAFGVAIAYVDSRPAWDDTGITAGTMMLVAGVLGLLGPRRPWTWALLIGIWIPAYAVARAPSAGTLAMVLVLAFPFAGAYGGMALRRWSALAVP
jgi:hypothetical protein